MDWWLVLRKECKIQLQLLCALELSPETPFLKLFSRIQLLSRCELPIEPALSNRDTGGEDIEDDPSRGIESKEYISCRLVLWCSTLERDAAGETTDRCCEPAIDIENKGMSDSFCDCLADTRELMLAADADPAACSDQ